MSSQVTELDRPVPLYMQVVRQLRARIAAGELAEGDRIPSQREMMQIWRISMQTASKVIGALKTEGLAIPSIGRDTIVAPGAAARIASASRGAARAPAAPPEPVETKVTVIKAAKAAAPADVAKILGIPRGRRALRRQETRSGEDGRAVSVSTMWYPPTIAEKAPRLADSQPIPSGALAYITEATATRATRAIEEHTAALTSDETAATLGIPTGSPVLITHTRHYGGDGKLIEYAETIARGEYPRIRTYVLTSN
jgi:DNA-binding GntR family transcriptional regulator